MKKITSAIAVIAAVLGTQAAALSCMRPDVARSFQWASDAEEDYVVLLGRFDFDARQLPATDLNNPVEVSLSSTFYGKSLGLAGFQPREPFDVDLLFSCSGMWCGSLPETEKDILAFVELTDQGYVLTVGPCSGNAFTAPRPDDVARVEACMRGEPCIENEPTR